MAWRGLHLTRPARLQLADGQLQARLDGAEIRIPLEDIAWIVLDTPQVNLSGALLSACMDAGIVILLTDARHTPSGLLLPFHSHHRQAGVADMQISSSAALKKRLWQQIIRTKINNQAACLAQSAGGHAVLPAMARLVASGDPDNVEARAAREYWKRLFPDFIREDGADLRNMLLNYGYAVLRAGVARALVAYGLLPAFGLHHASVTNAFNLADDLIEPFRPFVDLTVWRLTGCGRRADGEPSLTERQTLAGLLLQPARMGRDEVTLLVACEQAAASLVRSMEAGTVATLRLPALPKAAAAPAAP